MYKLSSVSDHDPLYGLIKTTRSTFNKIKSDICNVYNREVYISDNGSRSKLLGSFFSKEHFIELSGRKDFLDVISKSDYDLNVKDNPILENKLVLAGWKVLDNKEEYYSDIMTTSVLQKIYDDGVVAQLAFRKNIRAYNSVFSVIHLDDYWRYYWKCSTNFLGKDVYKRHLESLYYAYKDGEYEGSSKSKNTLSNVKTHKTPFAHFDFVDNRPIEVPPAPVEAFNRHLNGLDEPLAGGGNIE